jgi:uncharacterized membrane protein
MKRPLLVRLAIGHRRLAASVLCGVASFVALPATIVPLTRAIFAWDIGCIAFLTLAAVMFSGERITRIPADAAAQEEGEWTIFCFTVGVTAISFAAIIGHYAAVKDLPSGERGLHMAVVAGTLLVSWLTTQTVFAMRYAHEFYTRSPGMTDVDGGLDFPGTPKPDYWDFLYFSLVIGMTFQVSDVQISSRKLRRLVAVQALLGFLFNTVILALSVNIGATLL